jgi:hypothetical protein
VTGVRYAFYADGTDLWRDLSIELQERFGAEPAIWLGHPRHVEFASRRFPSCEVLDERELNIGNFERTRMAPLPHRVRESSAFLRFENAALYSLQRNAVHRDIGYLERRTYVSSLSDYLWGRLSSSGVEHVVAAQAPHTAAGLLLVGMFEALGIEMLHFDQVSLGPFMMPRRGLGYREVPIPLDDQGRSIGPHEPEVRRWVDNFRSQVTARRFAPTEERKSAFEHGINGPIGVVRRLRSTWSGLARHDKVLDSPEVSLHPEPGRLGTAMQVARSVRTRSSSIAQLKNAYDLLARPLGDRREFALFLLHYEPEKTTVPDGGLNGDQLAAVRTAASTLQDNVSLLVKEHPSQLMYVANGHTGRIPEFYRELTRIDGVGLVDRRASNWDLIDRASVVFTVTGTVGLEATFVDTPVVYFGYPWYAGLDGSYALGDVGSASATVAAALADRAPSGDATAENLVALISANAIDGVISPGRVRYFARAGWEPTQNVDPLTAVVARHLGLG